MLISDRFMGQTDNGLAHMLGLLMKSEVT